MDLRWSEEHYMQRFPEYNRECVECGKPFNALHLGSRRRITCSKACARAHAVAAQRENTRRYIKSEKYLAYRKLYYESIKAKRRLAKLANPIRDKKNSALA